MESKDTGQTKVPRESSLLFWVFFLTAGTVMAATGTFSHFTMGRWSGCNVRTAGWFVSALSVYGIFDYFRHMWFRVRRHRIFTGAFIFAILVSIPIPFFMVAYDLSFRPMYWSVILLLFGHTLHKTLTKGLGPTSHSTARAAKTARR
jgi:hypothetical protein